MTQNPYRAAGTFRGTTYMERQADRDLRSAILDNQRYPYVLAARQSGKSSLLLNVQASLSTREYHCVNIDFSLYPPTCFHDYDAFLTQVASDVKASFEAARETSPCSQTLGAIFDWALAQTSKAVVVFLDEVDALSRSPFKDTVFSSIRGIFNGRASSSAKGYSRLQFVLAGAVREKDLISDIHGSPFNVGESIELKDLSVSEVDAMAKPLRAVANVRNEMSRRIYHHTNGSVYLTQLVLERIWKRAADKTSVAIGESEIDECVDEIIDRSAANVHFSAVRQLLVDEGRRLQEQQSNRPTSAVVNDDEMRAILLFAGVGGEYEGFRNKIYARVFGRGSSLDLTKVFPLLGGSRIESAKPRRLLGLKWMGGVMVIGVAVWVGAAVEDGSATKRVEQLNDLLAQVEKRANSDADALREMGFARQTLEDKLEQVFRRGIDQSVLVSDGREVVTFSHLGYAGLWRREMGDVALWKILSGGLVWTLEGASLDGRRVVAVGSERRRWHQLEEGKGDDEGEVVQVQDMEPRGGVWKYPIKGRLEALAISPDGRGISVAQMDMVRGIEVGGQEQWRCTIPVRKGNAERGIGKERVTKMTYSQDSADVIIGTSGGRIGVLKGGRYRVAQMFELGNEAIVGLLPLVGGQEVMCSDSTGVVVIWSVIEGKKRAVFRIDGNVRCMAYSSAKRQVLIGSDTRVSLRDALTGNIVRSYRVGSGEVTDVGFGPQGSLIVATDIGVTEWDSSLGERIGGFSFVREVARKNVEN
jgi:ribosomal protein L31E